MLPVECKEDMKIIQYKAAIGDKLVLFETKKDYMTLKEAAEKWGVTPRRVNYYCAAGRIPGAVKMAGVWLLPKIAEKPLDMRTTQGRQQNENFYHRR